MKNKATKLFGALAIACIALLGAGCGNKITEGTVFSKHYEPERTWVQIIPIVISNGKTCTTTMIHFVHFDDEDWVIDIRKYDDEDGELDTARFYVSEDVYKTINEGDWFKFDEDLHEDSDPVVKEKE